jgi:uncharacterized membrane protein
MSSRKVTIITLVITAVWSTACAFILLDRDPLRSTLEAWRGPYDISAATWVEALFMLLGPIFIGKFYAQAMRK